MLLWRNLCCTTESASKEQDAHRAGHTLQHYCHTVEKIMIAQLPIFIFTYDDKLKPISDVSD